MTSVSPLRLSGSSSCQGIPLLSSDWYYLTSNSTHSFAYPVPFSFPSNVLDQSIIRPFEPRGVFARSRSVPGVSSLTTTSLTSALFSNYATFVDRCLKRKTDTGTGVETDDLRDLVNELWTLHDTYSSGDQEEEYFIDGGMAEDD
jgi:hypothetical protein